MVSEHLDASANTGCLVAAASRPRFGHRNLYENQAARSAEAVYQQLRARAASSRKLPLQDPRLSADDHEMTLNAAFLIPSVRSFEFTRHVGEVAEQYPGAELEVGGPWPAYSFVDTTER